MKRVIGFISILCIVLIGYYLQPVLFPPAQKKVSVEPATNQVVKHKALQFQKIKTAGYAQYISQPVAEFEKVFGQPTKIENSGFFFQTRKYPFEKGILEVNIEADKISTIKIMAKSADTQPFKFGMTSNQLSDQINLSADFSLTYDEEPVAVELSESDMRFRPLIAFDNNTFAMLFFNGKTEKMIGAVYADLESLLRLMPYQINSGNPLANRVQESNLDWPALNREKQQNLAEAINLYRSLHKKTTNLVLERATSDSEKMLSEFLNSPKKVLNKERLEEWQTDQSAHLSNLSFELKDSEFKKLAKENQVEYKTGFSYTPTVDPLFNLFEWISHSHLVDIFDDPEADELGVAIDQESVLILKQEPEKTKDSE